MTKNKFPLWNPQKGSLIRFNSMNRKLAYKAYRNSCSSFVAKKQVRKIILDKYSSKCVFCGSTYDLEIDHVKSVYACFRDNEIHECNKEENLQVLCKTCNTSKKP